MNKFMNILGHSVFATLISCGLFELLNMMTPPGVPLTSGLILMFFGLNMIVQSLLRAGK